MKTVSLECVQRRIYTVHKFIPFGNRRRKLGKSAQERSVMGLLFREDGRIDRLLRDFLEAISRCYIDGSIECGSS